MGVNCPNCSCPAKPYFQKMAKKRGHGHYCRAPNVVSYSRTLRFNSQMSATDKNDAMNDQHGQLPGIPELPSVPVLKPTLPPLERKVLKVPDEARSMGLAYTLPTSLAVPIIVLTLGGYYLDERIHRSPLLTLIGACVGTVIGFSNIIRIANRLNK